jgi:hypothetical protein
VGSQVLSSHTKSENTVLFQTVGKQTLFWQQNQTSIVLILNQKQENKMTELLKKPSGSRPCSGVAYTKPDIQFAINSLEFVEAYSVAKVSGLRRDMEMVMYRYFGTISSDDEYRLTLSLDREENVRKRVYDLYQKKSGLGGAI